jgi:molecular chaperone GrpE (heat shock protein)
VSAPEATAESGPIQESGLPEGVAEAIRATAEAIRAELQSEFDFVLPRVVEALRRDKGFDEISERLRAAERRIEARRERPLIVGVHGVLDRIRHFDFDPEIRQAIEDDLVRVLIDAGYEETGQVGEAYDPVRHDAIDGRAVDGKATVTKVHTRGLTSYGDVVVRAKVEISPGRSSW